MRGWVAVGSGTSGSPAAAILLADSATKYTDPRSNTWTSFLDWAGFGLATETQDPLADTSVTTRDANGLAWLAADSLGNRTRQFFDTKGNPTTIAYADDAKQQYGYNSFSEPTQATDPISSVTTYSYETHGNLTQVTEPDPDGAGSQTSPVWNFTYTAKGSVSTATDPLNHTTTYAYDTRNRLTATTDASVHTVTLAYNSASNVTSRTDQRGNATNYTFDAMGRMLTAVLPDANPNNHPTWTYSYDAAGNRTGVTDPLNHTTTYSFDALNRQTSATDPLGHTTTYAYDAAGNGTSTTDPLNHTTTYAYDAANRQTAVGTPAPLRRRDVSPAPVPAPGRLAVRRGRVLRPRRRLHRHGLPPGKPAPAPALSGAAQGAAQKEVRPVGGFDHGDRTPGGLRKPPRSARPEHWTRSRRTSSSVSDTTSKCPRIRRSCSFRHHYPLLLMVRPHRYSGLVTVPVTARERLPVPLVTAIPPEGFRAAAA